MNGNQDGNLIGTYMESIRLTISFPAVLPSEEDCIDGSAVRAVDDDTDSGNPGVCDVGRVKYLESLAAMTLLPGAACGGVVLTFVAEWGDA